MTKKHTNQEVNNFILNWVLIKVTKNTNLLLLNLAGPTSHPKSHSTSRLTIASTLDFH